MTSAAHKTLRYQDHVAADLLAVFPKDVRTVLDVGCGDGYVSQQIRNVAQWVGVDRDIESLKVGSGKRAAGNITTLPFRDQSFDLVVANDVVEHLDSEDRKRAFAEMSRISCRYIMLTVPLLEDLNLGSVACAACGRFYHMNHHLASFDPQTLRAIFANWGFGCRLQVLTGDSWQSQPTDIIFFRRLLGLGAAPEDVSVCPSCGSTKIIAETREVVTERMMDNWVARICSQDKNVRDMMNLRTECIGLYQKEDSRNVTGFPSGFVDAHFQPVTLNERLVSDTVVECSTPDIYRRSAFPLYSPTPYFVASEVGESGATIRPKSPVNVGFFAPTESSDGVHLLVKGTAEKSGVLRLWHYDTYEGYHAPLEAQVNGAFLVSFALTHARTSCYGIMLRLESDKNSMAITTVTLQGVKQQEIRIYDNSAQRARFWRLRGDGNMLLSLPFYGSNVIEAEWMRIPAMLSVSPESYTLQESSVKTLTQLRRFAEAFMKSEAEHLFCLVQTAINDRNVLQVTYGRTFGQRMRRLVQRVRASLRTD